MGNKKQSDFIKSDLFTSAVVLVACAFLISFLSLTAGYGAATSAGRLVTSATATIEASYLESEILNAVFAASYFASSMSTLRAETMINVSLNSSNYDPVLFRGASILNFDQFRIMMIDAELSQSLGIFVSNDGGKLLESTTDCFRQYEFNNVTQRRNESVIVVENCNISTNFSQSFQNAVAFSKQVNISEELTKISLVQSNLLGESEVSLSIMTVIPEFNDTDNFSNTLTGVVIIEIPISSFQSLFLEEKKYPRSESFDIIVTAQASGTVIASTISDLLSTNLSDVSQKNAAFNKYSRLESTMEMIHDKYGKIFNFQSCPNPSKSADCTLTFYTMQEIYGTIAALSLPSSTIVSKFGLNVISFSNSASFANFLGLALSKSCIFVGLWLITLLGAFFHFWRRADRKGREYLRFKDLSLVIDNESTDESPTKQSIMCSNIITTARTVQWLSVKDGKTDWFMFLSLAGMLASSVYSYTAWKFHTEEQIEEIGHYAVKIINGAIAEETSGNLNFLLNSVSMIGGEAFRNDGIRFSNSIQSASLVNTITSSNLTELPQETISNGFIVMLGDYIEASRLASKNALYLAYSSSNHLTAVASEVIDQDCYISDVDTIYGGIPRLVVFNQSDSGVMNRNDTCLLYPGYWNATGQAYFTTIHDTMDSENSTEVRTFSMQHEILNLNGEGQYYGFEALYGFSDSFGVVYAFSAAFDANMQVYSMISSRLIEIFEFAPKNLITISSNYDNDEYLFEEVVSSSEDIIGSETLFANESSDDIIRKATNEINKRVDYDHSSVASSLQNFDSGIEMEKFPGSGVVRAGYGDSTSWVAFLVDAQENLSWTYSSYLKIDVVYRDLILWNPIIILLGAVATSLGWVVIIISRSAYMRNLSQMNGITACIVPDVQKSLIDIVSLDEFEKASRRFREDKEFLAEFLPTLKSRKDASSTESPTETPKPDELVAHIESLRAASVARSTLTRRRLAKNTADSEDYAEVELSVFPTPSPVKSKFFPSAFKFGNELVQDLDVSHVVNGPVMASETESNDQVVNGPVMASETESNDQVINGPVMASETESNDQVINGPVMASETESNDQVVNEPVMASETESNDQVVNGPVMASESNDQVVNGPVMASETESNGQVIDGPVMASENESNDQVVNEPVMASETESNDQVVNGPVMASENESHNYQPLQESKSEFRDGYNAAEFNEVNDPFDDGVESESLEEKSLKTESENDLLRKSSESLGIISPRDLQHIVSEKSKTSNFASPVNSSSSPAIQYWEELALILWDNVRDAGKALRRSGNRESPFDRAKRYLVDSYDFRGRDVLKTITEEISTYADPDAPSWKRKLSRLSFYYLYSSHIYRSIIIITIICHMIIAFWEAPLFGDGSESYYESYGKNLLALNGICCCIEMVDTVIHLYVWGIHKYSDPISGKDSRISRMLLARIILVLLLFSDFVYLAATDYVVEKELRNLHDPTIYEQKLLPRSAALRGVLLIFRIESLQETAACFFVTIAKSKRILIVGLSFITIAVCLGIALLRDVFDSSATGRNFHDFRGAYITMFILIMTGENYPDTIYPTYSHGKLLRWLIIFFAFLGTFVLVALVIAGFYRNYERHLAFLRSVDNSNNRIAMIVAFLVIRQGQVAGKGEYLSNSDKLLLRGETHKNFLLQCGAPNVFDKVKSDKESTDPAAHGIYKRFASLSTVSKNNLTVTPSPVIESLNRKPFSFRNPVIPVSSEDGSPDNQSHAPVLDSEETMTELQKLQNESRLSGRLRRQIMSSSSNAPWGVADWKSEGAQILQFISWLEYLIHQDIVRFNVVFQSSYFLGFRQDWVRTAAMSNQEKKYSATDMKESELRFMNKVKSFFARLKKDSTMITCHPWYKHVVSYIVICQIFGVLLLATSHGNRPFVQNTTSFFALLTILDVLLRITAIGALEFLFRETDDDVFSVMSCRWDFYVAILTGLSFVAYFAGGEQLISPLFPLSLPSLRLVTTIQVNKEIIFGMFAILHGFFPLLSFLLAVMYIASVLAVSMFSGMFRFIDETGYVTKEANFNSMSESACTLFQIMLGEGWDNVLYAAMDTEYGYAAAIFIISFVMLVSILFGPLFIGLMCEAFRVLVSQLEKQHEYQESKQRRMLWKETDNVASSQETKSVEDFFGECPSPVRPRKISYDTIINRNFRQTKQRDIYGREISFISSSRAFSFDSPTGNTTNNN